jgi:hypothetical protein
MPGTYDARLPVEANSPQPSADPGESSLSAGPTTQAMNAITSRATENSGAPGIEIPSSMLEEEGFTVAGTHAELGAAYEENSRGAPLSAADLSRNDTANSARLMSGPSSIPPEIRRSPLPSPPAFAPKFTTGENSVFPGIKPQHSGSHAALERTEIAATYPGTTRAYDGTNETDDDFIMLLMDALGA